MPQGKEAEGFKEAVTGGPVEAKRPRLCGACWDSSLLLLFVKFYPNLGNYKSYAVG